MTSTMVLVGRCQPWTPPSPMPTVPSSQAMRTSSQRSHRMVSTHSILVGFAIGSLHVAAAHLRTWYRALTRRLLYHLQAAGGLPQAYPEAGLTAVLSWRLR